MTILSGSKKGQIQNYFTVVIFLFVMSFSFMVSMLILKAFVTEFEATGNCLDEGCRQASAGFLRGLAMWDNIILLVLVVLIITVGLTSYRLPAQTAFFIQSFLMAPFLGYVSYFFNYVFQTMVSESAFDAVRVYFPKTILICTNFHWIALAAFVVGSITLYAKREKGQFVE